MESDGRLEGHGIPPGGEWHKKQVHMLADKEARYGSGGFAVAWEMKPWTCPKTGCKNTWFRYGVYECADDFYTALYTLPTDKRYGYELIPADTPCRNYADVEWMGERDATHKILKILVAVVRTHCKNEYQHDPELAVACSTRPAGPGLWKNSYHIVVGGLVFQSNHGAMKAFWADIQALLPGAEWHWDNNGQQTHVIDMAVYTRNRVMRLPLCSKRGGVPFTRISGDPLDVHDDFTSFQPSAGDDPEAWEPLIVSNPTIDGDSKRIPDPSSVGRKRVSVSRKRASAGNGAVRRPTGRALAAVTVTAPAADLPLFVIRDLQQRLDLKGSQGCDVTGHTNRDSERLFIQCKNSGPRCCLSTKGFTHEPGSNTASMWCHLRDGGHLWYTCRSERCKGKSICLDKSPQSLLEWLREPPDSDAAADAADADSDAAIDRAQESDAADADRAAAAADAAAEAAAADSDAAADAAAADSDAAADNAQGADAAAADSSPTYAPFRHNVTDAELNQLLSALDSEDLGLVTPILKRFGYREVWKKWPAVSSLSKDRRDQMWIDCDAEACEKDLNEIANMVNTRRKDDDSTGVMSDRKSVV